jgi:hypothetical protein
MALTPATSSGAAAPGGAHPAVAPRRRLLRIVLIAVALCFSAPFLLLLLVELVMRLAALT